MSNEQDITTVYGNEVDKQLKTSLKWEVIEIFNAPHVQEILMRTKVPGGWLVKTIFDRIYRSTARNDSDGIGVGSGVTFIADPENSWNPKVIKTIGPTLS